MTEIYNLPPEWHPQDAVMLTWPHANSDWAEMLDEVTNVYFELIAVISHYQSVLLVVESEQAKQNIEQRIHQLNQHDNRIRSEKIVWVIAASNDTWARDHGPITLIDAHHTLKPMNFTFTGWGNKFDARLDNQINLHVFNAVQSQNVEHCEFVLEGGAIESDGNGALLTTRNCLLNPNRNPDYSEQQIEAFLKQKLGVEKILWLEHGALEGDDTDAHIDTLARFAPGNKIIFQSCDDTSDSHFDELKKMQSELAQFTNSQNETYELIALPWPEAQFNSHHERLPATYANFLIINQAVLLPVYGVPQDSIAEAVMQTAFPKHKIIGINCRVIIEQFGSLHCLTMQLPEGFLREKNDD